MAKETFFNLEDQKRKIIIESAIEEFSKHTFLEASVNRIVEKAGISKGSLYQYFEDKKDLYLFLIEHAGQLKLDYLKKQQIQISFENFNEGFESLLFAGSKFSMANPQLSQLVRNATQGELIDESLRKMQEMNRSFLVALVDDAKKQNQIDANHPTDLVVFLLNVISTQFYKYLFEQSKDTYSSDEIYEKEMDDERLRSHIHQLVQCLTFGISPKERR